MIQRFRKKPMVVEAVKWDGFNFKEIKAFAGDKVRRDGNPELLQVTTPTGVSICNKGGWVCHQTTAANADDFWPIPDDILRLTYDPDV